MHYSTTINVQPLRIVYCYKIALYYTYKNIIRVSPPLSRVTNEPVRLYVA